MFRIVKMMHVKSSSCESLNFLINKHVSEGTSDPRVLSQVQILFSITRSSSAGFTPRARGRLRPTTTLRSFGTWAHNSVSVRLSKVAFCHDTRIMHMICVQISKFVRLTQKYAIIEMITELCINWTNSADFYICFCKSSS